MIDKKHIAWRDRELERKFSQDRVRIWLAKYHNIDNEVFLKYAYDQYTYLGGYRPIRKAKNRKRIVAEFERQESSKILAKSIIEKLMEIEETSIY